ncbi:hypothetical protein ACFWY5_29905 [Nonomuraea sp. NPDC059007]|uniref:hypothetical protein n=1 Tax=Nonomuraea sp. NPDC059007 TaxID=3346692 RepID=UPI0036C2F721
MDELNNDPAAETAEVETTETTDVADKATPDAEVEKWKALSRKWEDRAKNSAKELDEIKRASLTDAERALEDAKAAAKAEALAEFGGKLAEAELRTQAARAGVELPDSISRFVNVSALLDDSGQPNAAAISEFVSTLAPVTPAFPNVGVGPQNNGGGGVPQLTYDDIRRMSPYEIDKARVEGRLNALLGLQ